MNWLDAIANPLELELIDALKGSFDEITFEAWVEKASGEQYNLWCVGRTTETPTVTSAVGLYTSFIEASDGDTIYAGNKAFETAAATLDGIETANMIRKGQLGNGCPFTKFASLAS